MSVGNFGNCCGFSVVFGLNYLTPEGFAAELQMARNKGSGALLAAINDKQKADKTLSSLLEKFGFKEILSDIVSPLHQNDSNSKVYLYYCEIVDKDYNPILYPWDEIKVPQPTGRF